LHAVDLARGLGIPRVLIPPNAATLSAFGMLTADVIKDYVRTIMCSGDSPYEEIEMRLAPLVQQGQADLAVEGVPDSVITLERLLDMRYEGQSYELTVPFTRNFLGDFHDAHNQAYGYNTPDLPIEVVNLRLRAVGSLPRPALPQTETGAADPDIALFGRRPVVLAQGVAEVPFFDGQELQPGHQIIGPAVIVHSDTTIFLGSQDQLAMDGYNNLIIKVKY
jgi:N-methylhydantoinase A